MAFTAIARPLFAQASRSICTAAATRLEAQGGQISGRDWEVFKAEMGNFLSKKQVVSNAVRDGLWFLFTVAVQKATKARRRSSQRSRERNVVAHHFFERVRTYHVEHMVGIKSSFWSVGPRNTVQLAFFSAGFERG